MQAVAVSVRVAVEILGLTRPNDRNDRNSRPERLNDQGGVRL